MQLPAKSTPASQSQNYTTVSQKSGPKKLTLIIADDNPDDQFLIMEAIKMIDIDVEHTAVFNGRQLMDLLTNQGVYKTNYKYPPSGIILDLSMPLMDGLVALKLIRQLDYLIKIPIFILHSVRHDDYLNQCSELGVEGIFAKPSNFPALQVIIKNIYHSCGGTNDRVCH